MEIFFVFLVLGLAIFFFVTALLPVELVALGIPMAFIFLGVLSPVEALSGFSHSAVITIGSLLVLSSGLHSTGALSLFVKRIQSFAHGSETRLLILFTLASACLSAFINNTAAVAILLPLVLTTSRLSSLDHGKLLIPLSFASIMGGACSLIGTNSNLIVDSVAWESGMNGFSMFEFTPLGILLTLTGLAYLWTIGSKLLPRAEIARELLDAFQIKDDLHGISILPDSPLIGKPLKQSELSRQDALHVLKIIRDGIEIYPPLYNNMIHANDILIVHGEIQAIQRAQKKDGFHIVFAMIFTDHDFQTDEVALVRAMVRPDARIYGLTPEHIHFRQRFGADILALLRKNEIFQHELNAIPLNKGDLLLLYGRREALENLRHNPNLLLLDEIEEGVPQYNPKAYISLAIMVGVVLSVSAGLLPIVTAAPLGAFGMLLTRCLTLSDLYDSVKWSVVILIGGTLALGTAMQTTGAADIITTALVNAVSPLGHWALLGVFYLTTSFLTNTIGNSAAAILMAPIALSSASALGLAPKPLLLAVLFAAATSFNNPACYPTNSMVFGTGRYSFRDFIKIGFPLTILFFIVSLLMIPVLWPL